MLAAWGRFVFRNRVVVLVCSVLLVAAAALSLRHGGNLTTGTLADLESTHADELARQALGDRAGPTVIALFRSDTMTVDDPSFYSAMDDALSPLEDDHDVADVLSPVEAPTAIGDKLVSADRHEALAVITLHGTLTHAEHLFPSLRARIKPGPLTVSYTGEAKYRADLDTTLRSDLLVAELVSFPLALLVLLIVFRSVVAATLPVVVGGLAVLTAIACVLQIARVTDMAQYTLNVASLIGLGLAIDYSLFYTSRFREELAGGATVAQAIEVAMDTAGHAVLGSGLAVGVGLSGLLFFRHSYVSAMGLAGGVVVLLSVASALTLLPALLAVLGKRVDAGALRLRRRKDVDARGPRQEGRLWRAIVPRVMAHPVIVLVPTLAVVLALGTPFFRLRTASAFVGVLPMKTESRATYERIRADFPAQADNRLAVVVHFPTDALTLPRVQALRALRDRIAALPGVVGVDSLFDFDATLPPDEADRVLALPADLRPIPAASALESTSGHGTYLLVVRTRGGPRTDQARAAVHAIRQDRVVADGSLVVGGLTAIDVDMNAFFRAHTPAAVGFVALLTYVILFFVFRSVVLPLKAVLSNLLSISASFGALVWIFQEGHLSGLLAFEPGPIEPTLPVLLFCVVFGLSMDYEVLLLSRMREEWLAHGDNTRAVTEGLARSGSLITSAAAIMVLVFAAFSLATVIMVKAMGVAMAIAIALDATLVRTLLVPATMRLFGRLNWWAPFGLGKR